MLTKTHALHTEKNPQTQLKSYSAKIKPPNIWNSSKVEQVDIT